MNAKKKDENQKVLKSLLEPSLWAPNDLPEDYQTGSCCLVSFDFIKEYLLEHRGGWLKTFQKLILILMKTKLGVNRYALG